MLYAPIGEEMGVGEFSLRVAASFGRDNELIAPFYNGRELIELLEDGRHRWRVYSKGGELVGWVCGKLISWKEAVELSPQGLVLEFGVRYGTTIRAIAEAGRLTYGFDWWGGLLHDEEDCWFRESCKCERPSNLPSNVTLIDGLFSDTLEGFLGEHDGSVAFVNLDCDLYSSTIYVLHCLMGRFVKGSIVAFSAMTFSQAQRRAFDRYLRETNQDWELIGKQHWAGEVYRLA
jgi:hypothetical protein